MKVLAIDASGSVASVAVVEDSITVGEFTANVKTNHSITLMPMADKLLSVLEMSVQDMDYIACASGPGSFTGLRIGAGTAKGLAHGCGKKIIPVPTLDALAYNVYNSSKTIVPLMDARRGQVYTAFYQWQNAKLVRVSEYFAEDINTVIDMAEKQGEPPVFTGDGSLRYSAELTARGYFTLPAHINAQRAAAVGALAIALGEASAVEYGDFVPFYLRKPQAERERENAGKHTANDA